VAYHAAFLRYSCCRFLCSHAPVADFPRCGFSESLVRQVSLDFESFARSSIEDSSLWIDNIIQSGHSPSLDIGSLAVHRAAQPKPVSLVGLFVVKLVGFLAGEVHDQVFSRQRIGMTSPDRQDRKSGNRASLSLFAPLFPTLLRKPRCSRCETVAGKLSNHSDFDDNLKREVPNHREC